MTQIDKNYKQLFAEMDFILDNIPALIFVKDINNHYLRVNKFIADAHNLSKDELVGKTCFDLYSHPEATKYWNDDLEVVKNKKSILNVEEKWETDSKLKWVSTNKIPIFNELNEVEKILGISLDITKQKIDQEKLEIANKNLHKILDNLPIGIIVVSDNREIISLNKSALDIFGYDSDVDLVNKKCYDYICSNVKRCPILHDKKKIDRSEKIVRNKNGIEIPVLKSVITIELNSRLVLIEAFMDISEIKDAQKKLEESESKFRYVLNNLPVIIYRYDFIKEEYDYISPASSKIIGYTPEEIAKMGIKQTLRLIHPDDRKNFIKSILDSNLNNQDNEQKREILFRFKHKLYDYRWMKDSQTIIYSDQMKPIYLIGNILDIHDEKMHESLLKDFNNKLEQTVKERTLELSQMIEFKNNFYSAVSHELKTPLNGIQGFLDLLLNGSIGNLTTLQKEILLDASKSAKHLNNLFNDLLEISKIDTGKKQIKQDIVDLNYITTLLRLIFEEVNYNSDFKIIFNVEKSSDQKICIDLSILNQIFRNFFVFVLSKLIDKSIRLTILNIDNNLILKGKVHLNLNNCDIDTIFRDFDISKSLQLVNNFQTGLNLPIIQRLLPLINGFLDYKYNEEKKMLNFEFILNHSYDFNACSS